MVDKLEIMQRLQKSGIVAVVRTENAEQARQVVDALKKGGIEAVEITMTVPGAVDVIKEINASYDNSDIFAEIISGTIK